MNFSKRVNRMLFLLLIVVNIVMRYPLAAHEGGMDGFFMHATAYQLIIHEQGHWLIHPYSYLGFYPLSYPASMPFLLGSITTASFIDVELSVLLLGMVMGILSAFSMFMLLREMKKDDMLCFLGAILFSTSPLFVTFSAWQASSRLLFMGLLPMFCWLLIRCRSIINARNYILLIIPLTLAVLASHRLAITLFLLIIAFFVSNIVQSMIKMGTKSTIRFQATHTVIRWSSPFAIMAIIFGLLFFGIGDISQALNIDISSEYEVGAFFVGTDTLSIALNIIVSLFGRAGILLPFAVLGIFILMWKKNKTQVEYFIIASLLALTPFISVRTYGIYAILVFLTIFIAYGLNFFLEFIGSRKKQMLASLVFLLVTSMVFSNMMTVRWTAGENNWMSEDQYETGLFLRYEADAATISPGGDDTARAIAISGNPDIHTRQDLMISAGWIEPADFLVRPIGSSELSFSTDTLFIITNNYEKPIINILHSSIVMEDIQNLFKKYDIQYAVEDNSLPGGYRGYGNEYQHPDVIFYSLHGNCYRTFNNGEQSIWFMIAD